MAKRPSEDSTADRSFKVFEPRDIGQEGKQRSENPVGRQMWTSVRSRQSGNLNELKELRREIEGLKELLNAEAELKIGGR